MNLPTLHFAIIYGDYEMVISILELRKERIKNVSDEKLILDLQALNNKNQTACDLSLELNKKQIFQLLKEHGGFPKVENLIKME